MGIYLDFNKHEKGYKPFIINTKSVKNNKGKRICYVNKRDICPYRGYYNVRYGILHSKRYSTLFLDECKICVDIRDIVECGIEC